MERRKGGMLVFLGPGRSGTTSLYYAFRSMPGYIVHNTKESGAVSFKFRENKDFIKKCLNRGIFVELTPSNLLASNLIISNISELCPIFISFILIDRPVTNRLWSLYLHHLKLGNIKCSFDDYIRKSAEIAEKWNTLRFGDMDLTYAGLAEYKPQLVEALPSSTIILNFSSLFNDVNLHLKNLGLPLLTEIKRNESFAPNHIILHRIATKIYRIFGMESWPCLDSIKIIYKKLNSRSITKSISSDVRKILIDNQKKWNKSLERFSYVSKR